MEENIYLPLIWYVQIVSSNYRLCEVEYMGTVDVLQ